jgi:hypothetical protein
MASETYRFTTKRSGAFQPMVPIRITNPATGKFINTNALLDTGADGSCFPAVIANVTGHNLKGDGVESAINFGIGGSKVNAYKHTFIIQLLSKDRMSVLWTSKPILVDCLDHNNIPPILGSIDFHKHFNMEFNYKKWQIVVHY